MPKSEIAGLYSHSIFRCLRGFRTAFRSDCASLPSRWPCRRLPFPPHLLTCCLQFCMLAALPGVRWHLTAVPLAVLTCTSLIVGNAEPLCWPLVCLLWRGVYLGLLPIFNCVVCSLSLSCMSCLCVLEIKPLLVASFANILLLTFICFLFILFIVPFAVQKLVSLIRSHLFIFAFFLLSWETDLRKHWHDLCQRMFCLCSLLRVFWWGDFLLADKRASVSGIILQRFVCVDRSALVYHAG